MRIILACVLLFASNAVAQGVRIPESDWWQQRLRNPQYVDFNGRLVQVAPQVPRCQCFYPSYSYPIYVSPYPPPYVPAGYRFSVPVGQQYTTDPPTIAYPDGRLEWRFDRFGNTVPPWGVR